MKYYIDITIRPDKTMHENVLLNQVYTKLHQALHKLHCDAIGVSFPQYRIKLGRLLRLHGSHTGLNDLQSLNWLDSLTHYCNVGKLQIVPENCQYRVVSRVQSTMTQAKLKRLKKRHTMTDEDMKRYKGNMFCKGLDNPYLELASHSNGNKYRRYLQFGELRAQPTAGKFDLFGLSRTATVPWF